MDKFYLGKDKRPKRRKYADFPYTISQLRQKTQNRNFT